MFCCEVVGDFIGFYDPEYDSIEWHAKKVERAILKNEKNRRTAELQMIETGQPQVYNVRSIY